MWDECWHPAGRCDIKHQAVFSRPTLFAGLLLVAVLVAGCGGGSDGSPTHIPTRIPPTPTQRSTPLPGVQAAPVVGQGDRQIVIHVALFGDDPTEDARQTAARLQQQLRDDLDMEVTVTFANETDAFEALCSGAPDAAWVSPYTVVAAQEKCGAVPALAIRRGRPPLVTVGQTAEILALSDITTISQLRGQTFCRSDEQDIFTSWIFPGLVMSSQGVDPMTALGSVYDYPDDLAMLSALANGNCAAVSLPPERFDDLLPDLADRLSTSEQPVSSGELADRITVLSPAGDVIYPADPLQWQGYPANVIPYETLVFAPSETFPDDLRQRITDVIDDYLNDRVNGTQRQRDLLDSTGVFSVDAGDFTRVRNLITNANVDMTFGQ